MSKGNRQLIFRWLLSIFVVDGPTSKLRRVGLLLTVLLNITLFLGWQWLSISAFFGELGPIYGETDFPLQRVNDLRIHFSGPTMLVETASGHATILICNDGQKVIHDIHLALVSPNGEIRVSGGNTAPNTLHVTELLPGATYEHVFALTTIKAFSSMITPTLDLHIEYDFTDPAKIKSQWLTGVYSFKIGQFASLHRAVAQGKKVSVGITSSLESLNKIILALVGALATLAGTISALRFKRFRDFVSEWINGMDKKKDDPK